MAELIPKTWHVLVRKLGGHTDATVRRGVEGSRGKCGELIFDESDVDDIEAAITEISGRLVTVILCSSDSFVLHRDLTASTKIEIKRWLIERFGIQVMK